MTNAIEIAKLICLVQCMVYVIDIKNCFIVTPLDLHFTSLNMTSIHTTTIFYTLFAAPLQDGQAFATSSIGKSHPGGRKIERMASEILLAVESCASQM